MTDLIARLKTRPLPVRRRIAIATAGAATALVAVVWFTASLALGSFGGAPAVVATAPQNQNLAGAAAAVIPTPADDSSTAGLTIIETATSSTLVSSANRTIIPF
jgi:hypothetical protein